MTTHKNIEDALDALERMREDFDDLRGHPTAITDFNKIRKALQNACAPNPLPIDKQKALKAINEFMATRQEATWEDVFNIFCEHLPTIRASLLSGPDKD